MRCQKLIFCVDCDCLPISSIVNQKVGKLKKKLKKVSVVKAFMERLNEFGPILTPYIKQYLPKCVTATVGQTAEIWGNELRKITCLFVNLGFREAELSELGNPKSTRVVKEVQRVVS